MTAPRPLTAKSHRDIPSVCACDWRPAYRLRRLAFWERVRAVAGCPAHWRQR